MNSSSHESDAVLGLADRFFKAIENGDVDTLRQLYSDDAIVWHNYDRIEARSDRGSGEIVKANIALLSVVPRLIQGIRYEVWHRERTGSGFVQQHLVTGASSDGDPIRFAVCVVCRVIDGRIAELYEYLDLNQLPQSVLRQFGELSAAIGSSG